MPSTRREFLGAAALAAGVRPAAAIPTPAKIRAFCIDFNWYQGRFAPPGHWADASPEEHVAWYAAAGVNTIQTFCVSCNGYAWYKGGFVPPQPGLKHDFLTEVVRLGHQRGMMVTGYFCVGANGKWGHDHPDLSYGTPSTYHIPFTEDYLDYLAKTMVDAIRRTGLDGYMIDWVWNPQAKLRAAGWIPAEQALFAQLTGNPFPKSGTPTPVEQLVYERAAIERVWQRIREARDRANPDCVLWLSCARLKDPTVVESGLLKQCDWVMNEAPSRELLEAARSMVGAKTRLIQNVVGWVDHDARSFLGDRANAGLDIYGFAEPRDNSLPLPVAAYLAKPVAAFKGKDRMTVNDRNIAVMTRFYRGLALDSVTR
jgi:hypothetical protein